MKRFVSLVLCAVLAIGSVTYKPPKAEAVALELTAALVGKVVGVTLISLGMAWAVDKISENTTGQRFGENVAREIQNWLDEEHECEVIDVFFGGMMPNTSPDPSPTGNVVLTASVAFVAAVSAFGRWLYEKYALSENESAVVSDGSLSFVGPTGTLFNLIGNVSGVNASPYYVFSSVNPSATILYDLSVGGLVVWDYSPNFKLEFNIDEVNTFSIRRYNKSSGTYTKLQSYTVNSNSKGSYAFCVLNGIPPCNAGKSKANGQFP